MIWTSLALPIIAFELTAAQLLQTLPPAFANSSNVAWVGPDQFALPWPFSRAPEGEVLFCAVL